MAAATADKTIPAREGIYDDLPVLAAKKIFQGTVVSITAAGFATFYAGTDVIFAGFADKLADNTDGASGDIKVRVRRDVHVVRVTLTSAAQADVGDAVYASDDSTLTLTAATNMFVGRVAELEGTNSILLKVMPQVRKGAAQANSAAADVAAMVVDFNLLLAKLRAAGLMDT